MPRGPAAPADRAAGLGYSSSASRRRRAASWRSCSRVTVRKTSTPPSAPATSPGRTLPRITLLTAYTMPKTAPTRAICVRLSATPARSRPTGPAPSLPLDRARRLGRDVQDHAVDLADLADHARRDLLEQVVRQPGPVGGHGIVGRDGAD